MNDTMMNEVLVAFQQGMTADVVRFCVGAKWGAIFTLPPASASAMARAGDQFHAIRATNMLYVRRARLRIGEALRQVIVVTALPERRQQVIDCECLNVLPVPYLRDDALSVLEERIGLSTDMMVPVAPARRTIPSRETVASTLRRGREARNALPYRADGATG